MFKNYNRIVNLKKGDGKWLAFAHFSSFYSSESFTTDCCINVTGNSAFCLNSTWVLKDALASNIREA